MASFGYDYSFRHGMLQRGKPIPPVFSFLTERISQYTGTGVGDFAELLVTEYPPGSVINWHRDAPPFELVCGLSLLSPCTFRFRPVDKMRQTRSSVVAVQLEPGSLYVLSGESRWEWQHSTAPVKSRRISVTLRTLKNGFDAP